MEPSLDENSLALLKQQCRNRHKQKPLDFDDVMRKLLKLQEDSLQKDLCLKAKSRNLVKHSLNRRNTISITTLRKSSRTILLMLEEEEKSLLRSKSLHHHDYDDGLEQPSDAVSSNFIRRIVMPVVPKQTGRNLLSLVFLDKWQKGSIQPSSDNKLLQLNDIANLNNRYCLRNKKFPYRSNSMDYQQKIMEKFNKINKEKSPYNVHEIIEPQKQNNIRTRNIKLGSYFKGKKKYSNTMKSGEKHRNTKKTNENERIEFVDSLLKNQVLVKSRNKIASNLKKK